MKRVMCVYLPRWPLQNLQQRRPDLRDKPLVIVERQTKGAQVAWCNPRAAQAGVRTGMPLAEALATQSRLAVHDHDPAGDRFALERLAEWAQRFSPLVGLEECPLPECLLLDISGCAACFHGEDRLIRQAARELRARGCSARLAIARSVGAAWAVAHHLESERTWCVVPSEETEKVLASLPVTALRLPEDGILGLAAIGIHDIGGLASLPRSSVPGRFGASVLRRLDQALGRLPEPIVPHRELPPVQVGCSFEYPTDRRVVLQEALDVLLERVEEALRRRNRGARQLECWFFHEEAEPCRIDVGLFRPSRSAQHLGKLLRTHLERVQLVQPVVRISVRVPAVEFIAQRQFELFDDASPRMAELGDLIDRLASQLGRDAVTFPRLVDDCQPEYACCFEPAMAQHAMASPEETPLVEGQRPLQVWSIPMPIEVLALFPGGMPQRFVWQGREYIVRHSWGPERIETGWWRGCDVHRDYYVVATHLGTRLWLFRDEERWFLHGCFD